jgi:SAM-dependent methyltransferase
VSRASQWAYSDAEAAALYDILNPWSPAEDFYAGLIKPDDDVLDVGCGTGTFLRALRDRGHRGRLAGIDPDRAALERAREIAPVELVEGTAATIPWTDAFDLAIMISHAFQFLVTDEEIASSLAAIRAALRTGGRFAFETRNPLRREWEGWTPDEPIAVTDPAGRDLRIVYNVEDVTDDIITLTESTTTPDGEALRVDRTRMRFLDRGDLNERLTAAGFAIQAQYGDWDSTPWTTQSREIITIAAAVVK